MSSLGPTLVDKEKAIGSILHDIDLSKSLQQVATAMTIIGAWIGSFAAAVPATKIGTRKTLIFNNIFWILGGGLCAIASVPSLLIGRFCVGLATGIISTLGPPILSEIAPAVKRGAVTSLHQLQVTIGILVASLVCYGFVTYVDHGWRWALLMPALLSGASLFFTAYLPESPVYLVRAGRRDEAHRMLLSQRGSESEAREEITAIANEIEAEANSDVHVSWAEVFSYKRPMLIGLGLMFFQPLSGINAIIFYSTKIFGIAGVHEDILATVSVCGVNVIMTVVSMYLVERAGRRILLVWGLGTCAAALAPLGIVLLAANDHPSVQGVLAILLVIVYIIGFAVGPGAVSWVVMSETVPNRIRNKAMSAFLMEAWFWNLLIALFTLTAIDGLGGGSDDDSEKRGVAILFLIFAAICIVGVAFIMIYIPETKGLSQDAIWEAMGINKVSNFRYLQISLSLLSSLLS